MYSDILTDLRYLGNLSKINYKTTSKTISSPASYYHYTTQLSPAAASRLFDIYDVKIKSCTSAVTIDRHALDHTLRRYDQLDL